MIEQMIALLVKYQAMRAAKTEYDKNASRPALNRHMKLQLELDAEVEKLKQALEFLNEQNNGQ